jgi:hypothetical protein
MSFTEFEARGMPAPCKALLEANMLQRKNRWTSARACGCVYQTFMLMAGPMLWAYFLVTGFTSHSTALYESSPFVMQHYDNMWKGNNHTAVDGEIVHRVAHAMSFAGPSQTIINKLTLESGVMDDQCKADAKEAVITLQTCKDYFGNNFHTDAIVQEAICKRNKRHDDRTECRENTLLANEEFYQLFKKMLTHNAEEAWKATTKPLPQWLQVVSSREAKRLDRSDSNITNTFFVCEQMNKYHFQFTQASEGSALALKETYICLALLFWGIFLFALWNRHPKWFHWIHVETPEFLFALIQGVVTKFFAIWTKYKWLCRILGFVFMLVLIVLGCVFYYLGVSVSKLKIDIAFAWNSWDNFMKYIEDRNKAE